MAATKTTTKTAAPRYQTVEESVRSLAKHLDMPVEVAALKVEGRACGWSAIVEIGDRFSSGICYHATRAEAIQRAFEVVKPFVREAVNDLICRVCAPKPATNLALERAIIKSVADTRRAISKL